MPLARAERDFTSQCLLNGVRHDCRSSLEEFRPIEFEFGPQSNGQVLLSLGYTRVLSTISGFIAPPKSNKPSQGQLNVRIDLSPVCVPAVMQYAPQNTSQSEFIIQVLFIGHSLRRKTQPRDN